MDVSWNQLVVILGCSTKDFPFLDSLMRRVCGLNTANIKPHHTQYKNLKLRICRRLSPHITLFPPLDEGPAPPSLSREDVVVVVEEEGRPSGEGK